MSTNSVIAEGQGSTLRGRYCHSDGYPTHQGRALWHIVQRDGLEQTRQVMLYEHYGWSFLDPTRETQDWSHLKRDIHEYVAGIGLAYKDDPDDVWADPLNYEWAYILDRSGLIVLFHGRPMTNVIPWDGPEPDWEAIEKKGWG